MLHGNPTWSFFYRNLVLQLRDRYRLIVPDHLGCGLSDKPQDYPYRLADHIDNLEQLIDHLGIERHALMVHDWGGAIGYGYAERHPERLDRPDHPEHRRLSLPDDPLRIRLCRAPRSGAPAGPGVERFRRGGGLDGGEETAARAGAPGLSRPLRFLGQPGGGLRFVEDIPLEPAPSLLGDPAAGGRRRWNSSSDLPTLILWGGKDFCFNRPFLPGMAAPLPRRPFGLSGECRPLPAGRRRPRGEAVSGGWLAEYYPAHVLP